MEAEDRLRRALTGRADVAGHRHCRWRKTVRPRLLEHSWSESGCARIAPGLPAKATW